jgi:hypothetical protein
MMPSFKIDEVDKKELAEKFSTVPPPSGASQTVQRFSAEDVKAPQAVTSGLRLRRKRACGQLQKYPPIAG